MATEEYEVSSELYSEFDYTTSCKPTVNPSNIVSKFPFRFPPDCAKVDSDGDLVVERKPRNAKEIEIEHSKSTVLGLVGLQVWRGAFLLADWLLHNGKNLPKDEAILELGSGTGITSIVAAMYAPVICTDINKGDILKLIRANVDRNKNLDQYPVTVTEIDFTKNSFNSEVLAVLPKVRTVLAADVIYDNELTEDFVKTVERLLGFKSIEAIYVALEKRYVFTIEDCDTVAPCYEFFLECLGKLRNVTSTQVPIDFPQYFHYDRVKELVIWKISRGIK